MTNISQSSIRKDVLFVLILVLLSAIYGLIGSLNNGPNSKHQWRQADCLSITQNYTQENLPFLEPQIHWQGEKNTGKAISEFPIIYYGVGQIWKLTGTQYWIYRTLNLLILFTGLLFLRKIVKKLIQDEFWSFFIPIFLFTSPILIYYSNNFLMNSTAFGIALIAGYHFLRFKSENRYLNLIYCCALFTLTGVLKITSLMLFFGLGAYLLYDVLIRSKSLRSRWKEFIPFATTLVIIFIWYSYAAWYSEQNLYVFLQGTLPIWDMNGEEISSHLKSLNNNLKPEFFYPPALFILFISFLYILLFSRKGNEFFLALTSMLIVGIVLYMLLFFKVFDVHDYYLLNLLIIIPALFILALQALKNKLPGVISSRNMKVVFVFVVVFMIYNGTVRNRIKYTASNDFITNSSILTSSDSEYWKWYHWNYKRTLGNLETIEPYLNSIGVTRDKRVISIPDNSINVSLYLMNRKGFTDFGYPFLENEERIEWAKSVGAEYLIINDPSILDTEYLQPYLRDKVGDYNNVKIYKL